MDRSEIKEKLTAKNIAGAALVGSSVVLAPSAYYMAKATLASKAMQTARKSKDSAAIASKAGVLVDSYSQGANAFGATPLGKLLRKGSLMQERNTIGKGSKVDEFFRPVLDKVVAGDHLGAAHLNNFLDPDRKKALNFWTRVEAFGKPKGQLDNVVGQVLSELKPTKPKSGSSLYKMLMNKDIDDTTKVRSLMNKGFVNSRKIYKAPTWTGKPGKKGINIAGFQFTKDVKEVPEVYKSRSLKNYFNEFDKNNTKIKAFKDDLNKGITPTQMGKGTKEQKDMVIRMALDKAGYPQRYATQLGTATIGTGSAGTGLLLKPDKK